MKNYALKGKGNMVTAIVDEGWVKEMDLTIHPENLIEIESVKNVSAPTKDGLISAIKINSLNQEQFYFLTGKPDSWSQAQIEEVFTKENNVKPTDY